MPYDLAKFGIFGSNVLGLFGRRVTLPNRDGEGNAIPANQRSIKAVFNPSPAAVVDEYSNITYQEYTLTIPPDGLGQLEAEMIVTVHDTNDCASDGQTYYVANVAPAALGWWTATLQEHS